MDSIFNFIKWLFSPLYILIISVTAIIALILGTILDPVGAVNTFLCKIIDVVFAIFPSTPDNLKLGFILQSFSNQFPFFGWGIILDTIQTVFTMLLIVITIKVYKLIPFKAT